tara:strand:- start:5 stop:556 length:552 start_codon:yes stop_codon:yes gene_type:complete
MYIYVNEFYKNLALKKTKLNIDYVKNTIIYIKNNIDYFKNLKIPDKIIYFIIYLTKHNCKINIIQKIIYNTIKKVSHCLSLFVFNITQIKWINVINIAINNNVEKELVNYFLKLYDIYLNKENNDNMYIFQAKNILNINIKNKRHLYKYFNLCLYHTVYYIDIIFSIIDKKYLSIDYIYTHSI